MRLSRQEAMAVIRECSTRPVRDSQEAESLQAALLAWAILIDDTLMECQKRLSGEKPSSQQEWENRQTRQALANVQEQLDRLQSEVHDLSDKISTLTYRVGRAELRSV